MVNHHSLGRIGKTGVRIARQLVSHMQGGETMKHAQGEAIQSTLNEFSLFKVYKRWILTTWLIDSCMMHVPPACASYSDVSRRFMPAPTRNRAWISASAATGKIKTVAKLFFRIYQMRLIEGQRLVLIKNQYFFNRIGPCLPLALVLRSIVVALSLHHYVWYVGYTCRNFICTIK